MSFPEITHRSPEYQQGYKDAVHIARLFFRPGAVLPPFAPEDRPSTYLLDSFRNGAVQGVHNKQEYMDGWDDGMKKADVVFRAAGEPAAPRLHLA